MSFFITDLCIPDDILFFRVLKRFVVYIAGVDHEDCTADALLTVRSVCHLYYADPTRGDDVTAVSSNTVNYEVSVFSCATPPLTFDGTPQLGQVQSKIWPGMFPHLLFTELSHREVTRLHGGRAFCRRRTHHRGHRRKSVATGVIFSRLGTVIEMHVRSGHTL